MRDLMVASTNAPFGLLGSSAVNQYGLTDPRNSFWFNGATDANLGFTPQFASGATGHYTHDLGMAFDLGVSQYIAPKGAQKQKETLTIGSTSPVLMQNLHYVRFNPNDPLDLTSQYDHIPNQYDYEHNLWNVDNAVYLTGLLPAIIGTPTTPGNDQVSALRDALALYAAVRGETWSGANIVSDRNAAEEAKIRAALFGDGTQTGALISQILIGATTANDYPNIHEVLTRLGIASGLDTPSHFHVYLNPPKPVTIGAHNLLTDPVSGQVAVPATQSAIVQTGAQGLLDYANTLIEGEELMFIMDIPAVPPQQTPIVLAQAATPGATVPLDYILKDCQETESTGDPRSVRLILRSCLRIIWSGTREQVTST
jgi:hypothetical protein